MPAAAGNDGAGTPAAAGDGNAEPIGPGEPTVNAEVAELCLAPLLEPPALPVPVSTGNEAWRSMGTGGELDSFLSLLSSDEDERVMAGMA